mgnify:CR=1 FL=1
MWLHAARLSETGGTFARVYLRRIETAIAFAGEKKLYFVHFSVAVVPAVSCWPASVAAEASLVSKLARGRVLCAKKFALRGLMVGASAKKFALLGPMVGVSAKKFALRTRNAPKLAFCGVLGELFRGRACEGSVLGEVFRGHAPEGTVPGESCRRQAAVGSRRRPPPRAPAPREPGKPATASCRRKTQTLRRRTRQSG